MTAEHQNVPARTVGENSIVSFSRFATRVSAIAGSAWIFILACLGIIIWLVTGPYFGYSDTWQLIINTATTVITFLMVFLIQNTQNRDTLAINLKLDEIIRSIRHAHNEMINIEKLSDEELADLAKHYERIREEHDHRAARKLLNNAKKNIPA
jgi:low affinity Fe/Cu permease